jgi:imidazolonepropionase-like amidohydrolase
MKSTLRAVILAVAVAFSLGAVAMAQFSPSTTVLFDNVRVFDGKSSSLTAPTNVLVVGNKIAKISTSPIPTNRSAATTIIEGGGRTLMPGLIDAHTHILMESIPMSVAMTADIGYVNLVGAKTANEMLMRGFTSIRDLGGPSFSLKRAIDEGLIPGPRIYPSGAFISQTSGHGDFRMLYELPRTIGGPPSHMEQIGVAAIADSPDEVRLRARENLMRGASQIKLMAGGGIASPYDPLDVAQYTEAEIRAAVEAADNWGTYVTVHAYTPKAIQTAIAAGVKCIDHGQLAD